LGKSSRLLVILVLLIILVVLIRIWF